MSYITLDGKLLEIGLGTSSPKGFEGLLTGSLKDVVSVEELITPEIASKMGLVSTEGLSPKNIERLTWFTLNDPRFETELSLDAREFIRDIATDSISNGTIREAIVSNILEYNHSTKMHGYDATKKNGEDIEIKCEQFTGKKTKLSGKSAWGTSPVGLEKLKKDNPILVNAGFSFGKIQYIVEFEFNDSKAYKQIKKYLKAKKEGKTSAPKVEYGQWGNAVGDKIEVKLFKGYNEKAFTKPFLKFLKDNE